MNKAKTIYLSDDLEWLELIPQDMRITVDGNFIDYDQVPVFYMRGEIARWIEFGIMPGVFTKALITNDLRGCCRHGSEVNVKSLHKWVSWFHYKAPPGSFGSEASLYDWSSTRRAYLQTFQELMGYTT